MGTKPPLIGLNATYQAGDYQKYTLTDAYADAVRQSGGIPFIIPCHAETALQDGYLERLDGMVFTGGPDYPSSLYGEEPHKKTVLIEPRRVAADRYLARRTKDMDIPVLGICGGCQLLNIAGGGGLIQHLPAADDHVRVRPGLDREHPVSLEPGSLLNDIFNCREMTVNSSHHQAVDPARMAPDLRIIARAPDGTVEAVQTGGPRFVLGVQWHPERIRNEEHRRALFGYFIRECGT